MKRCLIVSPHFPPSTLAGVHRARHLAKHLANYGWSPTVVCVDPRHHVEALDPELSRLVPEGLRIVRTGALPVELTRPFGIAGDIGLRGYHALRSAVSKELKRERVDVVLITGSPYYPMLMANWICRQSGASVVLDFQDPWVSAEGARKPRWSKAGLAHHLSSLLEPHAARGSAWITSVSETQNDEMAERYKWLDRNRMTAIPIGGDPEDFEALRAAARPQMAVQLRPEQVNLLYIGTFLPRATPVVSALFKAAALLKQRQPGLARRLKLIFVGTSNQPNPGPDDAGSHRVSPIAVAEGVGDMVEEHQARVPFMDALALMANSDGLLLLGSDEQHYTASKIYPALMSRRPFLSLFHSKSSSHEILSGAGGGISHSFSSVGELQQMTDAIAGTLQHFGEGSIILPPAEAAAYEPYTARAVAGQFAKVFDRVAR